MITQERLKEFLRYDPSTGSFIWLVSRNSRGGVVKIGATASYINKAGYISIRLDKKSYLAHRLAHLYMTGKWPENDMDRIDSVRTNNAWSNLREATRSENMQNQKKPRSNNTTGFLGVHFYKERGNYTSKIKVNGKVKHLGYFTTPEEAHGAYIDAKRANHPFNQL